MLDVGDDVLRKTHVDIDAEKAAAVQEAVEAAERRHTRELRAAIKRLQTELEQDKARALERQKRVSTYNMYICIPVYNII